MLKPVVSFIASFLSSDKPILPIVAEERVVPVEKNENIPAEKTSQKSDFWSQFWWNVFRVGVTGASFTAIFLLKYRSSYSLISVQDEGPFSERELFQIPLNGTETPPPLALTPVSLYDAFPTLSYPTLPTFPRITTRQNANGSHLTYCEGRNHDLYCQAFTLDGNQPVNRTLPVVVYSYPAGAGSVKLRGAISLQTLNRTVLAFNRDTTNGYYYVQQYEENDLQPAFSPVWEYERSSFGFGFTSGVNQEGEETIYIAYTYYGGGVATTTLVGYNAANNLQVIPGTNLDESNCPTSYSDAATAVFQNNRIGIIYSGEGTYCGNSATVAPFIKFYGLAGQSLGSRLCLVNTSDADYAWEQQLIFVSNSVGIAGYNIDIDAMGNRRIYLQAIDPSMQTKLGDQFEPFSSLHDQSSDFGKRLPVFKLCGSEDRVSFVVYTKVEMGNKVGIYARECKYSGGSIVPVGDVVTITEEIGTLQFTGGLDCAYLGGNRFNSIFQMFQTSKSEASIVSTQSYDPYFISDGLTIVRNGTRVFSLNDLEAGDLDADTDLLQFTFGNVTHGQFEYVSVPGTPIFACTQKDVREGKVLFRHDGSQIEPSYSVVVEDPQGHTAGPSNAVVDFIPDSDPEISPISGSLSAQQGKKAVFFNDREHPICTNRFDDEATVVYQMADGTALLSWIGPYSNGTLMLTPDGEVLATQYGLKMTCWIEPFSENAQKTFYFIVTPADPLPSSSDNTVMHWVKDAVPVFSIAGTSVGIGSVLFGAVVSAGGTTVGLVYRKKAKQDYEKRAEKSKAAAMLYVELGYPLKYKKISEFNSGFYAFTQDVLRVIAISEDGFNRKSDSDQKKIIKNLAQAIKNTECSQRIYLYKWGVSLFGRSSINVLELDIDTVAKNYEELTNSSGDEYVRFVEEGADQKEENSSSESSDTESGQEEEAQQKLLKH
ncbi:MAG: hypothetical protein KKE46_00335 [Gammaproteobacteria bacterium]|nr:hypothetical protein [Gammaproteobacteria bacterium]